VTDHNETNQIFLIYLSNGITAKLECVCVSSCSKLFTTNRTRNSLSSKWGLLDGAPEQSQHDRSSCNSCIASPKWEWITQNRIKIWCQFRDRPCFTCSFFLILIYYKPRGFSYILINQRLFIFPKFTLCFWLGCKKVGMYFGGICFYYGPGERLSRMKFLRSSLDFWWYSKRHVTSNKAKSNLECAEEKFQTRGWVGGCENWQVAFFEVTWHLLHRDRIWNKSSIFSNSVFSFILWQKFWFIFSLLDSTNSWGFNYYKNWRDKRFRTINIASRHETKYAVLLYSWFVSMKLTSTS
jgi:hypothetical protein